MHIPDGLLDLRVAGLLWFGPGIAIGITVRRARGELGDERTPFLDVVAAGIFTAQMLNWSIPGGTSAHFVGGAFAGILLGPYLGVLVMSAAVTIQTLVFGDGGIITPGANPSVMVVVDVLVGYAPFRVLRGAHETGAVLVAGWGTITVLALTVDVGTSLPSAFAYELSVTVLTMVVGHALLGLVEGTIMAAAYGYVAGVRSDLMLGRLDDDSLSPEVDL